MSGQTVQLSRLFNLMPEDISFGDHTQQLGQAYSKFGHIAIHTFPWVHTTLDWTAFVSRASSKISFLIMRGQLSDDAYIDLDFDSNRPGLLIANVRARSWRNVPGFDTDIVTAECHYDDELDVVGCLSLVADRYAEWVSANPIHQFVSYLVAKPLPVIDYTSTGHIFKNLTIAKGCTVWINPRQTTIGCPQRSLYVPSDVAPELINHTRAWVHPEEGSIQKFIAEKALIQEVHNTGNWVTSHVVTAVMPPELEAAP